MTPRAITGAALALVASASAAVAEPVPRAKVEAASARIAAMAEEMVETGAAPGLAIAVVQDDAVVFARGFGLRRTGSPEKVDADTVFQIASLSKAVSATVVSALVSEGLVRWDARVRDLDPGFALHDPYPTAEVTVTDFLNHRSGLPGSAGNDLEMIGFDRATEMARLRLIPPESSFRSAYSYSNAGYTEGALAAARPTGQDWEDVARERLFEPLGMASSSYRYADFRARANAAQLHVRVDGAWVALVTRDPAPQAPAGGVSSSVNDLTRWMRLELGHGTFAGKPLIKPEALAPAHLPLWYRGHNPINGEASFYGLGWTFAYGRHGETWGHVGAFSQGALTVVALMPESGLGIVVLANAFPTGAPNALADSFFDLVFDGAPAQDYLGAWSAFYAGMFEPDVAAAKARFAAPPNPATPARPAADYAGGYANAYVGEARVEAGQGGLVLVIGPGGAKHYPLTHFDRDLFLYYPDAEMPDRPSAARFALGPDGRAVALTLESLDANGLGTLARADQPQDPE